MLKEEFQECKDQYLCHHKQPFLLHYCSTLLEKKKTPFVDLKVCVFLILRHHLVIQ